MNGAWSLSDIQPSPILSLDTVTMSANPARHPIRIVSRLDRNAIFRDMYRKLAK
jgi:hypothetical protein